MSNGTGGVYEYKGKEIQLPDGLLCICGIKVDLDDVKLDDVLKCQSCHAEYELELCAGMAIPRLIEEDALIAFKKRGLYHVENKN